MTNKVIFVNPLFANQNLYLLIENDAGQIASGSTLVSVNAANLTDYALAMTEQARPGRFEATFPTLAAGWYFVSVLLRGGSSPSWTDIQIAQARWKWLGTAFDESAQAGDLAPLALEASVDAVKERTDNLPDEPASKDDVKITVTPFSGQVGAFDGGPDLVGYLHSADTWPIWITGSDGQPADMTGKTLLFTASKACGCDLVEVFRVDGEGIVINEDEVAITSDPADITASAELVWALWDMTDAKPVHLLGGRLEIRPATSPDLG